jgi:hypothetical protein
MNGAVGVAAQVGPPDLRMQPSYDRSLRTRLQAAPRHKLGWQGRIEERQVKDVAGRERVEDDPLSAF